MTIVPPPMKATDLKAAIEWAAENPFVNLGPYLTPAWRLERKIDGLRAALVIVQGGPNQLMVGPRNAIRQFPEFSAIDVRGLPSIVLDGELTARGRDGVRLGAVTSRLNSLPGYAGKLRELHGPATFHAFDVVAVAKATKVPVLAHSYLKRREILDSLAAHLPLPIELVPSEPATLAGLRSGILGAGWEGVILKRAESRYKPGARSQDWLKVKRFGTADAFITGWKPGQGSNQRRVGSVAVSMFTPEGAVAGHEGHYLARDGRWLRPVEVASVGSGLTEGTRAMLTGPDGRLDPSFYGAVIEFMAQAITTGGRARHPHFVRFRPDKQPVDCLMEEQLRGFARA